MFNPGNLVVLCRPLNSFVMQQKSKTVTFRIPDGQYRELVLFTRRHGFKSIHDFARGCLQFCMKLHQERQSENRQSYGEEIGEMFNALGAHESHPWDFIPIKYSRNRKNGNL